MDTRTALLDCAETAARTCGYDGFSFADLAAGVGIRKASVHYHFPTKTDLALALVERYTERLLSGLRDIEQSTDTGADCIRAYIALNRDAIEGGSQLCLCVAFSAGAEGLDQPVLRQLDDWHKKATEWLASCFAMGREDGTITLVNNPVSEGAACLGLMEGAQLIARASSDITRFDQVVSVLLSRLR